MVKKSKSKVIRSRGWRRGIALTLAASALSACSAALPPTARVEILPPSEIPTEQRRHRLAAVDRLYDWERGRVREPAEREPLTREEAQAIIDTLRAQMRNVEKLLALADIYGS